MAGQFLLLPNMFFSGFMFPIASMPEVVQKLTYLVPLRYWITIVRGIFLKGVGWPALKDEAAILLAYGIVILEVNKGKAIGAAGPPGTAGQADPSAG
jgi:ABC-2 type transport system permease protein